MLLSQRSRIQKVSRSIGVLVLALTCGACAGQGNWGKGQWPSSGDLGRAAKVAAFDAQTWVPLLAAGALQIENVDGEWSEDIRQRQNLFDEDAEDLSSDLRNVATAAYLVTAVFAPSESWQDKTRGLSVGAATMLIDGALNQGLKDVIKKDRPNRLNDESMPSGHASKTSSRTNMAIRNLEAFNLAPWQKEAMLWGLHGINAATGLARVEAGKHYLSDVLVGYAVGHFVSTFMYEAFLPERQDGARLGFVPMDGGAALTIQIPLNH